MTKEQAIEQARFIKKHYVARMVFIYSINNIDENYEYSKENSRLLSATVKVKEISNFHENGILNYQLSIIKKD